MPKMVDDLFVLAFVMIFFLRQKRKRRECLNYIIITIRDN